MWLLAANCLIGFSGISQPELNAQEKAIWTKVQPSVFALATANDVDGLAVLIDDKGLFLAHRSVAQEPVYRVRTAKGQMRNVTVRAVDDTSQLVLLQALNWSPEDGVPIELAPPAKSPVKGPVLAILVSGPIRADLVTTDRYGISGPNRRLISMSELRFEAPLNLVAGAPFFDAQGHLIGILGATLGSDTDRTGTRGSRGNADRGEAGRAGIPQSASKPAPSTTPSPGSGLLPSPRPADPNPRAKEVVGQFGPNSLTIGYSVSPDILALVVSGFESPTHKVAYPAIGVLCKDAKGGGALVTSVTPNSPAALAGVMSDDIIVELAGFAINNQIDFAKVMMKQTVGKTITIRVRRNNNMFPMMVKIGS